VKVAAAALILGVCAWLIGESADAVGALAELVVMFVVPILVAVVTFAIVRRRRIEIAVLLAVITFAAAYGGRECFTHAFNNCVGSAADIKSGIERYRADTSPSSTSAWPDRSLPNFARHHALLVDRDGEPQMLAFLLFTAKLRRKSVELVRSRAQLMHARLERCAQIVIATRTLRVLLIGHSEIESAQEMQIGCARHCTHLVEKLPGLPSGVGDSFLSPLHRLLDLRCTLPKLARQQRHLPGLTWLIGNEPFRRSLLL